MTRIGDQVVDPRRRVAVAFAAFAFFGVSTFRKTVRPSDSPAFASTQIHRSAAVRQAAWDDEIVVSTSTRELVDSRLSFDDDLVDRESRSCGPRVQHAVGRRSAQAAASVGALVPGRRFFESIRSSQSPWLARTLPPSLHVMSMTRRVVRVVGRYEVPASSSDAASSHASSAAARCRRSACSSRVQLRHAARSPWRARRAARAARPRARRGGRARAPAGRRPCAPAAARCRGPAGRPRGRRRRRGGDRGRLLGAALVEVLLDAAGQVRDAAVAGEAVDVGRTRARRSSGRG